MANGRIKISNNAEQVVKDLISYIFPYLKTPAEHKRHREQLSEVFQQALAEYKQPLINIPILSYIEKNYIDPIFRTRSLDLEATGKLIEESEDDERHIILQAITLLLEQGKVESTSANTLVLDLLIKKLDKYEPLNEDTRLDKGIFKAYGSRLGIRETLRDTFVNKAKGILENWQNEKKFKPIIVAEESVEKDVKKLKVDPKFLEQLSLFRTGKSLNKDPKVRAKREIDAEIKSFARDEIVNPEQIVWSPNQKHVIGQIEDYKPEIKKSQQVSKLDLTKLSGVIATINAVNKQKMEKADQGFMVPSPTVEIKSVKKIGKLHDRKDFQETIKILEAHTKAKMEELGYESDVEKPSFGI